MPSAVDLLKQALGIDVVSVQVMDEPVPEPEPTPTSTERSETEAGTFSSSYSETSTFQRTVTFIEKNLDLRLVTGVVYEPNVVDGQGDWANAETVRKMAHRFAANYALMKAEVGTGHATDRSRAEVVVVETWLAPTDLTIGQQQVAKGSWIMTAYVQSDELWGLVKSGEFTGWSLEGMAHREPAAAPQS